MRPLPVFTVSAGLGRAATLGCGESVPRMVCSSGLMGQSRGMPRMLLAAQIPKAEYRGSLGQAGGP